MPGSGGVQINVRRVTTPSARPILLVHGLGVSGKVWQGFARRLLPEWSAIAPDLRGHGTSDAPAAGYAPEDYARDLALALGSMRGISPQLPVVGHSLGALVAVALGARFSELVSALVLVDPPLDKAIRNPDVEAVSRLRREPRGELENYLLRTNPGGGLALAAGLAQLFRQASDEAFETLRSAPQGHPATWDEARAIHCPVLVVQGEPAQGGLLGDAAAKRFTARLQRGTHVKIAGASHVVHASRPESLAAVVKEFLERAKI